MYSMYGTVIILSWRNSCGMMCMQRYDGKRLERECGKSRSVAEAGVALLHGSVSRKIKFASTLNFCLLPAGR